MTANHTTALDRDVSAGLDRDVGTGSGRHVHGAHDSRIEPTTDRVAAGRSRSRTGLVARRAGGERR